MRVKYHALLSEDIFILIQIQEVDMDSVQQLSLFYRKNIVIAVGLLFLVSAIIGFNPQVFAQRLSNQKVAARNEHQHNEIPEFNNLTGRVEQQTTFTQGKSRDDSKVKSMQGFFFTGETEGEYFGRSVANAGDVNGDGFSDIIVGAYGSEYGGHLAGRAYIFLGGINIDQTVDVILPGKTAGDLFGYSVSGAGDVNGDGYDDVIVGAYKNDLNGSNSGCAFIYFGGNKMDQTPDIILIGESSEDYFGCAVADVGDVNGDGFSDIIVGAYGNNHGGVSAGRAYIYFGGVNMDEVVDVIFTGEGAIDLFGYSVACAGDVNGDGYSDIIAGAYGNESAGFLAGRAYIYFGGANVDNAVDIILTGEAAGDLFGYSVASAGDINADGFSDVIVGANGNNNGGINVGSAYIYFGNADMDQTVDIVLNGESINNYFGCSVACAGDVNGDGYSDVIVGAYGNDFGGYFAGRAYIHFGGPNMDQVVDKILNSITAGNLFGSSVACAGDVNGDGFSEVIVGAHGNNAAGSFAGRTYIYGYSLLKMYTKDELFTGEALDDWFGYSTVNIADGNNDALSITKNSNYIVPCSLLPGDPGFVWDNIDTLEVLEYPIDSHTTETSHNYKVNTNSRLLFRVIARTANPIEFLVSANITHEVKAIPSKYILYQNYPNPFNPVTTIPFMLPERSHVTLRVMNMLGNVVAIFEEGELAAGFHSIVFRSHNLPSGMYLYQLVSGSFVQQRKMTIIK